MKTSVAVLLASFLLPQLVADDDVRMTTATQGTMASKLVSSNSTAQSSATANATATTTHETSTRIKKRFADAEASSQRLMEDESMTFLPPDLSYYRPLDGAGPENDYYGPFLWLPDHYYSVLSSSSQEAAAQQQQTQRQHQYGNYVVTPPYRPFYSDELVDLLTDDQNVSSPAIWETLAKAAGERWQQQQQRTTATDGAISRLSSNKSESPPEAKTKNQQSDSPPSLLDNNTTLARTTTGSYAVDVKVNATQASSNLTAAKTIVQKSDEDNKRQKQHVNEEQKHQTVLQDEQPLVDYAGKSGGALVIEKSSGWKGTSDLLTSDTDQYAMVPTEAKDKAIVISLSEEILVKTVALSNYERYSCYVKDFQISGSQTMTDWADMGTYTAKPGKFGKQIFDLGERAKWARYLKFRILSHYGDEHYLTITQISVHGTTMQQGFHEHWEEEKQQQHDDEEDGDVASGARNDKVLVKAENTEIGDGGRPFSDATNAADMKSSPVTAADADTKAGEKPVVYGAQEKKDKTRDNMPIGKAPLRKNRSPCLTPGVVGVDNHLLYRWAIPLPGIMEPKYQTLSTKLAPPQSRLFRRMPFDFGHNVKDFSLLCRTYKRVVDPVSTKKKMLVATSSNLLPPWPRLNNHPPVVKALASAIEKLSKKQKYEDSNTKASSTHPTFADGLKPSDEKSGSDKNQFPPTEAKEKTHPVAERQVTKSEPPAESKQGNTDSVSKTKQATPAPSTNELMAEPSVTHSEHSDIKNQGSLTAGHSMRVDNPGLALLLERIPSAACLKELDIAQYKSKLNKATNTRSSSTGTASSVEPIFKKLTDEIKALQVSLSGHEKYAKECFACFEKILLDILVHQEQERLENNRRLEQLENIINGKFLYQTACDVATNIASSNIFSAAYYYYVLEKLLAQASKIEWDDFRSWLIGLQWPSFVGFPLSLLFMVVYRYWRWMRIRRTKLCKNRM